MTTYFSNGSFSQVTLIGTVVADSKTYTSKKDGGQYTALTVLTSRSYSDKSGEAKKSSTRATVFVPGERVYRAGSVVSVLGRLGTHVAVPQSDTNKYPIVQVAVRDAEVEVIAEKALEGFNGTNSVVLEGRIGKTIREITAGNGGCGFDLAVSTKTDGTEDTSWIPVVLWGKKAKNFASICHTGDLVKVLGSLTTSTRKVGDEEKVLLTFVGGDFILDSRKKADSPVKTEEAENPQEVVFDEATEIPF